MNYQDYFDPIRLEKPENFEIGNDLFRQHISIHTANSKIKSKNIRIAIIGVPEERNSINKGCELGPNKIREKLYQLCKISKSIKISDFGNLKPGKKIEDVYFALRDVISKLISDNIIPIIIGGSQDLTIGQFNAYKFLNIPAKIITVDPRIDIGKNKSQITSYSYLSKILYEDEKYLKNYTNLGGQSYFISDKEFILLDKLNFETIRLGELRNNINEIEPYLRDSNLVSIDVSSIKQSDSPGHSFPSPNGLYSEEICQIARYTGISEECLSFGIFETNPKFDINNQSSHLIAQIIWFFIEGVANRYNEKPLIESDTLINFFVQIDEINEKIKFIKSKKSNRWWVEIPDSKTKNDAENKVIACTNIDYNEACNNKISNRIYNKMRNIT